MYGLEPELTNQFLIDFAECANNSNLDSEAAVARCLAGEQPGERPPPLRNTSTLSSAIDAEIEKCDGSDLTTQLLLEELGVRITTQSLLLHSRHGFYSVQRSIQKVLEAAKFGTGLYAGENLLSVFVSESQMKRFLEKTIHFLEFKCGTSVNVDVASVLNREAVATNRLLQLVAVVAKEYNAAKQQHPETQIQTQNNPLTQLQHHLTPTLRSAAPTIDQADVQVGYIRCSNLPWC